MKSRDNQKLYFAKNYAHPFTHFCYKSVYKNDFVVFRLAVCGGLCGRVIQTGEGKCELEQKYDFIIKSAICTQSL